MHSLRFLFAALSLAGCDAPGSTPSDVGGDGAVTDARDDTLAEGRVDEEAELTGLDQAEHAETAYNLASSGFHMDRVH